MACSLLPSPAKVYDRRGGCSEIEAAPGESKLLGVNCSEHRWINASTAKLLYQLYPAFFNNLYKTWFAEGIFPEVLSVTKVVPIPKKKGALCTASNIRLIGIRATFCNVMEIIVFHRLNFSFASNGTFENYQYGFLTGKSVSQAALALQQLRVQTSAKQDGSRSSRISEVLVSTDIESAFYQVNHKTILDPLRASGTSQLPINIIHSFRVMTIFDEDGTALASKRLEYGTVQGSNLSPSLFVLSLQHCLENTIA